MNLISLDTHSTRGRIVRYLAGFIAAAGLAWAAAGAVAENPTPTVKVDSKPVAAGNSALGPSYAPVVKRVAPSVVKVVVTEAARNMRMVALPPGFEDFFGGAPGQRGQLQQMPKQQGLGSGVIVTEDGYILTNNHVVQGADTIQVSLNDGREYKARVIGTDPLTDLAIVKVDAKNLPAITFADSDKVEVGDRVLAVGNPFGIGQTVTSGMVSGLGRSTTALGGAFGRPAAPSASYEDFIQTDAAINPGNSGGALVDAEARLVGINTAIVSESGGSQGIGFAIPANMARNIMEQLTTNGKVVRGFLGVSPQEITPDLAEQFKLPSREGALIPEVVAGSPAEKAGIKEGDVIVGFAGKPIADTKHLLFAAASAAPDTKVPVDIIRDGKKQTINVKVGEKQTEAVATTRTLTPNRRGNLGKNQATPTPAPAAKNDTGTLNGVAVDDIDARKRSVFDIPASVHGALVREVDPNSASATAGLEPGDVIEEINKKAVSSADDAVKFTEKSDTKKTLLRIWTQRGSRYLVVDESSP